MSTFTFAIKTMGCKANIYDSLLLENELTSLGGTPLIHSQKSCEQSTPDVYILNSCTVTAEADKQAHREIQLIKKKSIKSDPDQTNPTWTILTGCYAEVGQEKAKKDSNISLIIPSSKKNTIAQTIAERFGIDYKNKPSLDNSEIFWGQLPHENKKTRSFLKIQEGCNDFCTYCIIPYARGKSRSVRLGLVLKEIQRLVDLGTKEIVLTGTNIGDYGKEFGHCLEDLVEAILEKTSLERLRLTSLDPTEISDRLLSLMPKKNSHARLMPHFHVSLQSPVSRVLRAMKRDYKTEEIYSTLNRIYNYNDEIFVGMDVIAGFASETDQEHEEAMKILEQTPWTRLHVFPYSEREGTPALKIKQSVSKDIRKKRAHDLMQISIKRHENFSKNFINRTFENVLFENPHEVQGDFYLPGHLPNYSRVLARIQSRSIEDAQRLKNTVGKIKIIGLSPKPAQDWTLEGVIVE